MRLGDLDAEVYGYVKTWVCECSEFGRQSVMAVEDISYLPEIDPETLPIVRELREQLAKVTAERDAAMRGELIESIKLCLEKSPDKNTIYVPRTLLEKLDFVMQEDKTAEYFYTVKFEDGSYWSGYNNSDKQLRKAKLFISLKYANEVIKRFPQHNPQIVKVEVKEVQK